MAAEIASELFLMCLLKDGGRRESLVSFFRLADLAAARRRQESLVAAELFWMCWLKKGGGNRW